MAWTYSGDPAASELDQLRFVSGDVDQHRQLWQNEEIAFVLSEAVSVEEAARQLLQAKIRQISLTPRVRLGSFTFDATALISSLKENLEALGVTRGSMAPWAGGISQGDKKARESSKDRVRPRFHRGQFDNKQA